ncbi:hypothetical protein N624_2856 [Levilactobacillus brevis]|jgi:hypothetical protein|nr:hypothetical protein N624_2856 [Levilactobacillus brevis]
MALIKKDADHFEVNIKKQSMIPEMNKKLLNTPQRTEKA